MCFSAAASFGASALLAGTGIVAIRKIRSPRMLALASAPVLFCVQQLSEGILWLSFTNPEWAAWQKPSIYTFLVIAQVFWPIWVPLAVWLMEPDKARKKALSYFLWIGGITSLYMIYCLAAEAPTAVVESRHIRYNFYVPFVNLRRVLYFLATVVPIFLSSLRWMKLLGGVILASLILSFIFFTYYVISVWCFFAAVLSILILLVISLNKDVVIREK